MKTWNQFFLNWVRKMINWFQFKEKGKRKMISGVKDEGKWGGFWGFGEGGGIEIYKKIS
jgi:hypothetical protein